MNELFNFYLEYIEFFSFIFSHFGLYKGILMVLFHFLGALCIVNFLHLTVFWNHYYTASGWRAKDQAEFRSTSIRKDK